MMDAEPGADTPGAILDRLRAHPEWTERERDDVLDGLIELFDGGEIVAALRGRLDDLSGADAEAVLRLIEANPDPPLLIALAAAIGRQSELPPERTWEALAVLDSAGVLDDHPELAALWEELNELPDDGESIAELIAQIEDDPSTVWLALQGLGAIEPEVRPQILSGLADSPPGPGVVEFARLLAYSHDGPTRDAALAILSAARPDDPIAEAAWRDVAENHHDAAVAKAARLRLGDQGERSLAVRGTSSPAAVSGVVRSLVTAVDRNGEGTVVLSAVRGGEHVSAAFVCDVERGVREVIGEVSVAPQPLDDVYAELKGRFGASVVEGSHELALGLLAGSLLLCGPDAPPALRYWVEAVAGRDFRPHPFRAEFPGWDPGSVPFAEMPERASAVLDACPEWADDSALTFDLAAEIELRDGPKPPDPKRDAGAYRFLFEHRLLGRLEHYRRMLLWSAWLWRSAGDEELARSALALAWQLSDHASAVPGHPFTVALTTRSLSRAQAALRSGAAPRR